MVRADLGGMGSTVGLNEESTAAAATGIWALFTNLALMSAFLGFAIAQAIKFFTVWYKENRWDPKQLIGSGGMPSSHSATVTALAVGVGLQEGFGGPHFATALVLASVVMYDATGVRLHAGRQAEILCELPAEHPLAESIPLRELLGHTPTQVAAGAILGSVTAMLISLI
ncbi:hypothetical protein SASPL_107346 [Salvia splendens]|uniref:Acid phosphatase/vanadium-dependent haloperoxidase-related protein n=1 Tax=Salvia splendens TaxID=180675 RepID=A0A8X9A5M6_SALSN|nr:hypothetical protein SASPL_107346 [Salvia splendens]